MTSVKEKTKLICFMINRHHGQWPVKPKYMEEIRFSIKCQFHFNVETCLKITYIALFMYYFSS